MRSVGIRMWWGALGAAVGLAAALPAPLATAATASDPDCVGSYGGAPARHGPPLRFGIDPGLAGSAGGVQLPAKPDDPARDMAAAKRLRPPGRIVVVRLNRLFFSDGTAGIARFARLARSYGRSGFRVEIQVRYHPSSAQNGNLDAWRAYVRQVIDRLGHQPGVVAMTITNEVNLSFSPNTSDGAYSRAQDALIQGIETALARALRDHLPRLRFGFTYAYRFSPQGDAAFFSYLRSHGGRPFQRALGFVGLDFYPGAVYPPVSAPGESLRGDLAQAAGVLRSCMLPLAGVGPRVPIWITENGVASGSVGEAAQSADLQQLVRAAAAYSGTFNITDYRWFNLRDSVTGSPVGAVGPTFATDGLLRDDYSTKPAFAAYRTLIGALGARTPAPSHRRSRRRRRSAG